MLFLFLVEQECCFGYIVFDNILYMCDMGLMYLDSFLLVYLFQVVYLVFFCLILRIEMRKYGFYMIVKEEGVLKIYYNGLFYFLLVYFFFIYFIVILGKFKGGRGF